MKIKFVLLLSFLTLILGCEKNEQLESDFEFTELNGLQLKFEKSSYFILTANEISNKEKEIELLKAKGRKEIISFYPMHELSFFVHGKRIVNDSDYISEIYYTKDTSFIIILPRLIVFLKDNQNIENIISDFKSILTLEEQSKNQKYIFKCDVASSYEMITMVNAISKKSGVEWCEPDQLSSYQTFNN